MVSSQVENYFLIHTDKDLARPIISRLTPHLKKGKLHVDGHEGILTATESFTVKESNLLVFIYLNFRDATIQFNNAHYR